MSLTRRALWYIESHLGGDLSLEGIAASVGVSRFHLSRAFLAATGSSVAAYCRARRLSLAAEDLAAGAPDILTVALDRGYGSHEAFTRAFRQHFGLTPQGLRRRADLDGLRLQPAIAHEEGTMSATLARPRIVRHPGMTIAGLSAPGACGQSAAITALWQRTVPRFGELAGRIGEDDYGVVYTHPAARASAAASADDERQDYLCGAQVDPTARQPDDMVILRVPAGSYAVFVHDGHVSALADTWAAIWNHALEGAGLRAKDGPVLERYSTAFDPLSGMGGMEVWVPVEEPGETG